MDKQKLISWVSFIVMFFVILKFFPGSNRAGPKGNEVVPEVVVENMILQAFIKVKNCKMDDDLMKSYKCEIENYANGAVDHQDMNLDCYDDKGVKIDSRYKMLNIRPHETSLESMCIYGQAKPGKMVIR